MTNYIPRNDYVLLRVVDCGQSKGGVALPDSSKESKDNIVIAIGPKVEGLKVGDKVMGAGTPGVDFFPVPRERDLAIIKESAVVLIKEEVEEREVH